MKFEQVEEVAGRKNQNVKEIEELLAAFMQAPDVEAVKVVNWEEQYHSADSLSYAVRLVANRLYEKKVEVRKRGLNVFVVKVHD